MVALIDSDSLLYINLYNKDKKFPKSLEECKLSLDEYIFKIVDITEASHFLLFLTVGRNFRYSVKSDYKGNRKSDKPLYFNECKDYLINKYSAIYNENLEADDLINIYNKNIEQSFICACDSDILDGLEGSHFNYRKFEWVITNNHLANYKFWTNMISGTHNGVSGLKGKGIVYASKILDINSDESIWRNLVLSEYIKHYKDGDIGLGEFMNTYNCIRILDKYEGLKIEEPIVYDRNIYNKIIDVVVKEEREEEW